MLEERVEKETNKQKEQLQYLVIMFLVGVGYYFFFFLPEQRNTAKKEIKAVFEDNSPVTADDLDASLWKGFKSWQERLDKLYLPNQISKFSESVIEAIETKKKEIEEKKFRSVEEAKKKGVEELENYCSEKEKELPEFKKIIEKYSRKINNSAVNNISTLQKEANELIVEERVKKQKLHWKRKVKKEEQSWIDRELLKFKDTFEGAWKAKQQRGMNQLNVNAPYIIHFPPSLWDDLTEEEKRHEKAKELKLDPKVDNYKFNQKITEWYDKAEIDPVRGEKDRDTQKDNNALLYGAGGTGKSITVEKLAYKSDVYPLIVVQGSALTPKLPDQQCSVAVFEKFIFTIADINWTLIDDFNFKRAEGGEVRYILFVDEADQISENSFAKESTGLTFLKECMGSDDYKGNESWNLWIMATNHLKKIDEAAYRPGRLSNPLDFSWTLEDFIKYSDEAGITNQFPNRWLEEEKTLDDEDNKWVNRFNTMSFNDEFLPFWRKLIERNPNAEYEPDKEEENDQREENIEEKKKDKKIKIKWGEMFELFWRLKDSSQLGAFDGKFTNPRKPKIEQVVETYLTLASNQISKSIDIRLKGLTETAELIRDQSLESRSNCTAAIEHGLEEIRLLIAQLK